MDPSTRINLHGTIFVVVLLRVYPLPTNALNGGTLDENLTNCLRYLKNGANEIEWKLVWCTNGKSYTDFSTGAKIGDLNWPWTANGGFVVFFRRKW